MESKFKHYFAGGNTSKGFHSLFDSVFQGLDRIYILKGGPGNGKSTLIRAIAERMAKEGFNVELIHCSSDNESLDGLILPALRIGIVDGTAPHVIEPLLPGAVERYVDLGIAWKTEKLAGSRGIITEIKKDIADSYQKAYDLFAEALRIHDEWEAVYIHNMDFTAAEKVTEELIDRFYGEAHLEKTAVEVHRFLGAATPEGAVDYIPSLTADIKKRYFIKGRPGTGKSTMLKKLAAAGKQRGFDVEIYHCGFDPGSLDMVIVPELSLAIFDSTAPHEYFPERVSDEIVDMYERTVKPGTDEAYSELLEGVKERYSSAMKRATAHLAEARADHERLEAIYVGATDFSVIERIRDQILEEILLVAGVGVKE